MGEDGFVTVTRKGRSKKYKNGQTNTTIIRSVSNTDTRDKIDVSNSIEKVNSAVIDIEASELYKELCASVSSLGKIDKIRCYGLGHIGECVTARYQLGLLLSLTNLLGISKSQVMLFDPIFFEEEVEILSLLGFAVLSTNSECKDRVVRDKTMSKTLFFLPHCPKQMTNNLLWANWNPDYLPSCVLLCNSLESVVERTTEKVLNEEAVFIKTVVKKKIVTETPLSNNFKYSDVFNDLSLHTFFVDHDDLDELPEPKYKDGDTEFIRANIV